MTYPTYPPYPTDYPGTPPAPQPPYRHNQDRYHAQSWGPQAPPAHNQPIPGPQSSGPPLPSQPAQDQQPFGQQPFGQQPFGQQPYGHQLSGMPSYGQQPFSPGPGAPWAAPSPPKKTAALPWLIGGLVALLVAGGIGLVFLLQDDASVVVADSPPQGDPGNGDEPAPEAPNVPSPPTDCLVECTDTDAPGGGTTPDTEAPNYTGSADAALGFVQAIADGDLVTAHAALCGAGKDKFATPEELVADFYDTLGFTMITGGSSTDVYAADSTHDAVVFELETDAGQVGVEVYILEEGSALTICGYDSP